MYICENCRIQLPPHTPSHLVTIKKRKKRYPKRPKSQRFIDNEGRLKPRDDPGGSGFETVKEIQVCSACYAHLNNS